MSGERKDYAVLISLMTREEAEVVAAALRADGVDAFVGNNYHAHVDWLYTFAMGGLQVLVPWRRLQEARTLLRERVREYADFEPEAKIGRRDRWKIWVMVIGFYGGSLALSLFWAGLYKYEPDAPSLFSDVLSSPAR